MLLSRSTPKTAPITFFFRLPKYQPLSVSAIDRDDVDTLSVLPVILDDDDGSGGNDWSNTELPLWWLCSGRVEVRVDGVSDRFSRKPESSSGMNRLDRTLFRSREKAALTWNAGGSSDELVPAVPKDAALLAVLSFLASDVEGLVGR